MLGTMTAGAKSWIYLFEWAYSGVNFSLAGNGGSECVDFLPMGQRIAESILASVFSILCIIFALCKITLPAKIPSVERSDFCGKRILLVVMCLTFGIELGFKFATRQFIYIMNPCHITTMVQIYLLAAPPSKFLTALFRLHLHMLSGAPIAILFPVINTRLLPFETEVYYLQHLLMMVIPFYLIKIGGVYTAEPLWDLSWSILSIGCLYLYHFMPMQYLAVLTRVNLNNMLCPAVSDPFYGPYYRLFAIVHQMLALPVLGKIIVFISQTAGIKPDNHVNEIQAFKGSNQTQKEDKPAHESRGGSFIGEADKSLQFIGKDDRLLNGVRERKITREELSKASLENEENGNIPNEKESVMETMCNINNGHLKGM
ncbi:hypothetical protein CHS0354_011392 [Potamilus streckersoni]|uniref:Transmembrane protein 164 n=1 Tax=Potamilus streckersoni TaxID=2493646 RepID=A0AAE0WDT6_9BIVA|nr:hypothetical protein CHS0354_011392 [Potamilus streckersoni]